MYNVPCNKEVFNLKPSGTLLQKKPPEICGFSNWLCYIPKSKHSHQSGVMWHAWNAKICILLSLITKMVSSLHTSTTTDHQAQMLSTSLAAASQDYKQTFLTLTAFTSQYIHKWSGDISVSHIMPALQSSSTTNPMVLFQYHCPSGMIVLRLRQALMTPKLKNIFLDSNADNIYHIAVSTKPWQRFSCPECNTWHSFHTGHNLLKHITCFHKHTCYTRTVLPVIKAFDCQF